MNNKKIWEHLNKETAKISTGVMVSKKIINSSLFKKPRYCPFFSAILDSLTRTTVLTLYYLFDKKYSWSIYSISHLTETEKTKIRDLKKLTKCYIDFRHEEIAHSSLRINVDNLKRFQWLTDSELNKISLLVSKIGSFLNDLGRSRNYEIYTHEWIGVSSSLQCLIEDIEKNTQ